MSLERFCRRHVATILPTVTVREAATKMRERRSGYLVVVEDEKPVGVITDRDVAFRVVAEGRAPDAPVAEVMTREPLVVRIDDTADRVVLQMRRAGVHRLPVVDLAGRLMGLVSASDLLLVVASDLAQVGMTLGRLEERNPLGVRIFRAEEDARRGRPLRPLRRLR